MWIRYSTAPWWARWLLATVCMTLWLALFYWTLLPPGHWSPPWPAWISVSFLIATGMLLAAPVTALSQPAVNSYSAVLHGLTSAQLGAVGQALRGKLIPTDRAVLAAAVRAMDLAQAYRDRVTRAQRWGSWVMIAMFAVALPVLQVVDDRPRSAVMYVVLGVFMLVTQLVPELLRRSRAPRLVELRAAAEANPEVAAIVADAVHPALPTARERLMQVGLVVAMLVPVSVGAWFVGGAVGVDCRSATAVVVDIHDHRELLDPALIGPGGPELSEYQEWGRRLQRRADQVSDPGVAQPLRDIADLSAVAVALVEQARGPGVSGAALKGFELRYGSTVRKLAEADRQLAQVCS